MNTSVKKFGERHPVLYQMGRFFLIASVFFGGLELLFRLAGWWKPVPLFTVAQYQGESFYATHPDYVKRYFQRAGIPEPQPLWIPARKAADTKRVLVFGESAAAGFPMMGYNLARLIQINWDERFPDHRVELINLAVVAINSHVLRRQVREAMVLEPDAIVLYAGHNEVIGPYGPASRFGQFSVTPALARVLGFVRGTHTGRALDYMTQRLSVRLAGQEEQIWQGLNEFQHVSLAHDDPSIDQMMQHVKANFRSIIDYASRRGCQVLVCVPAVNLTDWPPLDSEKAQQDAQSILAAQDAGDLSHIRSAILAYEAARLRENSGDRERAWSLYRLACDLDRQRIRADSRIRDFLRSQEFDARPGIGVVDADYWLHEMNPAFDCDQVFFLEHVHLTFEGRVAVAALIVDGLASLWDFSFTNEPAMWWEAWPEWCLQARERTLFTPHEERSMWQRTDELLGMELFERLPGLHERRRAIHEQMNDLEARIQHDWDSDMLTEMYERARLHNPDDPLLHFAAGRLFSMENEFQRAEEAYERGFALQPNHVVARLNHALLHLAKGDTQRATSALRKLEPFTAKPRGAQRVWAALALHEGRTNAAIQHLQKHLKESPNDMVSRQHLQKLTHEAQHPGK